MVKTLVFVTLPLLFFCFPPRSNAQVAPQASPGIQGRVVAEIPFRTSSGLILVTVRINDSRELRMYLDTGMSGPVVVLFHKELAGEVGLQGAQSVLLRGAGQGERKPGTMARGATVKVGGLEMADQTVVVFSDSRETSPWQVDGIIGKTLFDKYLTRIDYENSVISLYDPAEARVDAPFQAVPVSLDVGFPIIETTLSVDGRADIPVKLVLDLGHRNALFLNVNAGKGIQTPQTTLKGLAGRGIQGEVPALIGRLAELKLGPFSLKNLPTSFLLPEAKIGLKGGLVDGDIGELIFNRFTVVLDYAHKRIFLAPNKSFDLPFEYDMSGMFLEQNRDDIYFVIGVLENSPAAENGIQKGDKILALNGQDVRGYKFGEVFALLRQDGQEVKLTIERGGERLEKALTLRRLI